MSKFNQNFLFRFSDELCNGAQFYYTNENDLINQLNQSLENSVKLLMTKHVGRSVDDWPEANCYKLYNGGSLLGWCSSPLITKFIHINLITQFPMFSVNRIELVCKTTNTKVIHAFDNPLSLDISINYNSRQVVFIINSETDSQQIKIDYRDFISVHKRFNNNNRVSSVELNGLYKSHRTAYNLLIRFPYLRTHTVNDSESYHKDYILNKLYDLIVS